MCKENSNGNSAVAWGGAGGGGGAEPLLMMLTSTFNLVSGHALHAALRFNAGSVSVR